MPLLAQEAESLHGFNLNLPAMGRWSLQLHGRLRANYESGNIYQVRGGPIASYGLSRNFALLGGYYVLEAQDTARVQRGGQRVFGGAQVHLGDLSRWMIDARWLAERHLVAGGTDFARVRQRLSAARRGRWQPFVMGEALWVQRGGWVGRYSAGLNREILPGLSFGSGYEYRQAVAGPAAHIWTTLMTFTIQREKRDGSTR